MWQMVVVPALHGLYTSLNPEHVFGKFHVGIAKDGIFAFVVSGDEFDGQVRENSMVIISIVVSSSPASGWGFGASIGYGDHVRGHSDQALG
jgi:hypothetical protein